jgi:dTDP-4-dehydrorhamnose reductase
MTPRPKRRLWVPGGRGMLGSQLAADANASCEVFVTGHEVDIADPVAVASWWQGHGPFEVVVNCAAYTAVDAAEANVDAATAVNATGPRVLAAACAASGARLVHVSTDYVFDGSATAAIDEDAPTNPLGIYGRSKLEGEQAVLAQGGAALVVRTSWLYGATHKNFVLTILKLMAERDTLRVVSDQRGRPTSTQTLSLALLRLVDIEARGVVHVADDAGPLGISWHDFAVAIRARALACGLPVKASVVEPIPTSAYPTPAKRPAFSVLSTARYEALTGEVLPDWRVRLAAVLDVVARR